MKSILILIISLLIFPFIGSTQVLKDIDQITPFHEELAAVRKGEQWAFINTKGKIVIDYRNDIVKSKTKSASVTYPYFSNGRCLIKQKINGISHYGYINKSGEVVIKPEYLNATNFSNDHAIVFKIAKEELGRNDLLDKKMVSYSYDEIVIDTSGNSKTFLAGPIHLVYKKDKLKKPPMIQSYFLSSNLVSVKDKEGHWQIYALNSSTN